MIVYRDEATDDLSAPYKPLEFVTDVRPLSLHRPTTSDLLSYTGTATLESQVNLGRRRARARTDHSARPHAQGDRGERLPCLYRLLVVRVRG